MGDLDDVDWPLDHKLGRKADQLEEDMHCPICTDFYDNPHLLLTCGHSFCSICIRKHFDAKLNPTNSGICPTCRKKGQSADLIKNVSLAAVVDRYKALRDDIYKLLISSLKEPEPLKANVQNNSTDGTSTKRRSYRRNGDITPPLPTCSASKGEPILCRIPQFNSHGATLQKIKNHIDYVTKRSKVKLRLDGDKDVLDRRLRELIHQINAQVDHHCPLTLDEVIGKVNNEEKMFEEEQLKAKKHSKSLNHDIFEDLIQKALSSKKRTSEEINIASECDSDKVADTDGVDTDVHSGQNYFLSHSGPPTRKTLEYNGFSVLQNDDSLIFPLTQEVRQSNDHTQATLLDPPTVLTNGIELAHLHSEESITIRSSIEVIDIDNTLAATHNSSNLPKKSQWHCSICTFINDKLRSCCVMCGGHNPNHSKATRRSSRGSTLSLKQQRLSSFS